ncbi:MAG: hypothetical protein ABW252_13685 [Polyangiales bacterium]
MYRLPLRLPLGLTLLTALTIVGCETDDDGSGPPLDAGALDASTTAPGPWPEGCAVTQDDYLPRTLECTGLYVGALRDKQLAGDVREFAPAVALWSDAADKRRFIHLPPGTTIDNTNPAEWTFPVGTKLWKEFRVNGQRVETRLFYKDTVDTWRRATYAWRADETAAEIWEDTTGVPNVVKLKDGSDYVLPTRGECNDCHKGRKDKALGFEQLLLGMEGATGYTLAQLAAEGRLSQAPARTVYKLSDDGTGIGAAALMYLHVNCGVSCHNESPTALAYPSGMYLRLDPLRVDMPMVEWNPVKTTLNVNAHISNFLGETRIVPGAPDRSLIIDVASTRGTNRQMPPIASRVVDGRGVALLKDWVLKLGALDGGVPTPPAGGMDGGVPVI